MVQVCGQAVAFGLAAGIVGITTLDMPFDEAHAHFARLPEYAATNASAYVKLLAAGAFSNPGALRSAAWAGPVVSRFCCEMLGRRELLTSPFTRYSLLEALYTLAQHDELAPLVQPRRILRILRVHQADAAAKAGPPEQLAAVLVPVQRERLARYAHDRQRTHHHRRPRASPLDPVHTAHSIHGGAPLRCAARSLVNVTSKS